VTASVAGDDVFAAQRARLIGLAYRMLGSLTDAEDIVQETWIRWEQADRSRLASPAAWLTTVTTHLAIDRLRSGSRRREEYPGSWLPEPIVQEAGPEEAAELADSLSLGFLVLLDELSPVERAVFILTDVFAMSSSDTASIVGKSPAACRQIASRARRRVQGARPPTASAADRAVVDGLAAALAAGDVAGVLARLAPDVVSVADGGAARRAARRPVVTAPRVARYLINLTARYAGRMDIAAATVNGDVGYVVNIDGSIDQVISFSVVDGLVQEIRIMRNPAKLAHVGQPVEVQ